MSSSLAEELGLIGQLGQLMLGWAVPSWRAGRWRP